jgi:hypothetical protein
MVVFLWFLLTSENLINEEKMLRKVQDFAFSPLLKKMKE